MPKRKQPKLLTELCLQALGEMVERLIVIFSKDIKKVDAVVASIREIVQSLPQSVGEAVSQKFLDVILLTYCPSGPIYIMTNTKRMILEKLVVASLHPKMRYVDACEHSQFLGRGVWKSVPNLQCLEHLSVGLAISYEFPTPIHFSQHLVELTCHYECRKEMIQEVAETCSALYKLDITNSSRVNDECVDLLLTMVKLLILKVEKTSLSPEGCAQLLYGLPKLAKFDSDYSIVKLWNVAQQPGLNDLPPLPLREVCIPWRHNGLAPLYTMQNLRKISIMASNYDASGLPEVIRIHGENLHALVINFMTNVCIVSIINGCPNLKHLSFKRCKFRRSDEPFGPISLPHFASVEELTVECECSFYKYPFLLYTKLRSIMLSGIYNLSDDELASALARGWLQLAQTVRFLNCGSLSINALNALVAHCNNLAVVGDLKHWSGIHSREWPDIIGHFKGHNFDFTVQTGDQQ